MAADLQKFLFKSKFLRKYCFNCLILLVLIALSVLAVSSEESVCSTQCENGKCIDNKCDCAPGWRGPLCQYCGGRVR